MVGVLTLTGGWVGLRIARHHEHIAADPAFPSSSEVDGDMPICESAALRIPFLHELTELYRYHYLLRNLVSRDFKVRYNRSVLGFLWAMINPLLTMAVLLVVFNGLFHFGIENYPMYILTGLLIWNLDAQGTTVAMRSVLDNSGTRKKICVPANVYVAAAIGSALVDLLFALVPLLITRMVMRVSPKPFWLLLPIPILQIAMFAFGVGVIVAALAVFFADMLDICEVMVNAYLCLTRIIYAVTILPAIFLRLEQFNPLYHFVDWFRANLIDGTPIVPKRILLPTVRTLIITFGGLSLFTRQSDPFAYRS